MRVPVKMAKACSFSHAKALVFSRMLCRASQNGVPGKNLTCDIVFRKNALC